MKKQYIIPLTEAQPMQSAISIMKTSIGMDGTNKPAEPGRNGAPSRRTEVF